MGFPRERRGVKVATEYKYGGAGFLSGLIIGGVIGAAIGVGVVMVIRDRERVEELGGKASKMAGVIKDEVFAGSKEIIKHAIDEGKEAVHKTRSGIEERRREKSEE
jgi:hypothetical protein